MTSSTSANRSVWTDLDEEDRVAFDAATILMRAATVATSRIDRILQPFELTFARFEMLLLLSWTRNGAMALSRMRDRLLVHQAAITNVVDRLERDGLIRRVPHARDRRTTLAKITSKGRKRVTSATGEISEKFQLGIPDEDAVELFNLVQQLRRAAREID